MYTLNSQLPANSIYRVRDPCKRICEVLVGDIIFSQIYVVSYYNTCHIHHKQYTLHTLLLQLIETVLCGVPICSTSVIPLTLTPTLSPRQLFSVHIHRVNDIIITSCNTSCNVYIPFFVSLSLSVSFSLCSPLFTLPIYLLCVCGPFSM